MANPNAYQADAFQNDAFQVVLGPEFNVMRADNNTASYFVDSNTANYFAERDDG